MAAGRPGDTSATPPQPAVYLADVPFFAQSRYQCGPAALATVLGASGVPVAPESLTDQVYVPGRKGSFQVELAAAARSHGRIPYPIAETLTALHAELAAGRPVLVLQNLAFGWAPRWHYAVVVGVDPDGQRIVLRSGRTARQVMRLSAFDRTWSLADRWGLVLLRPGELPAGGDPRRYLAAVVATSSHLTPESQALALDAGMAAWPEDADLPFAAANLARGQQDGQRATALYRRVLAIAPDHLGALNNLADLLSVTGCQQAAMSLVARGLELAGGGSPLRRVLETTRAEIAARTGRPPAEGAQCPEPGL